MSDITSWSTNPNNNNAVAPNGFPENMQKADVNNSARELMASMRRWYDAPEWLDLMRSASGNALVVARQSDTQIKITGADMRGYFPTDRRLKLTGGASPQYGLVTNTAMSGSDTLVSLTLDSGVVDAATNHVDLYFAGTLREQVLKSVAPLLQGKHTVWIPAGAMRPTSAKGAGAFQSVATGADKPDIHAIPFQDAIAASGSITFAGIPVNLETMVVNGRTFTFTTGASAGDGIQIKTTGPTQATETQVVLEAHAAAEIDAATYTVNAGVVTITHKTPGAAGNSFTLSESATNTTVSGTTLSGGSDETWVQFGIAMPKSWNEGTLTAIAFGMHQGSTASVLLELQGVAIGSTEPLSASYGTAVPLTFTTINANNVHKSPESAAMTLAGVIAEGDLAIFRLGRKPFNDNLAAPFLCLGLMLLLVYNAATDA